VIEVRVTPNSSKEGVFVEGEQIKVYVHDAPQDGQANEKVIKLLAKKLGVAKSRVEIVRGQTSRTKLIQVEGVSDDEARNLLA
jgi:uncharacterized protein